ncbi:putative sensor domain DACNV-containing protein [Desulfogranum japonicum]|uniref:putative sensor domain DACNV-containing protein n=1 Tax=Desulfogranum japonicum TaxID=231447 RepID=UPI00042A533F|nr:hypothetical protein [Desulfogranum japonicum]
MHVYPTELVSLITEKWDTLAPSSLPDTDSPYVLPDTKNLEDVISTCYQVSMMREENRPVNIRLIITGSEAFPAGQGPPRGFQRILFSTKRPFNEYELRRLSPAVDFERSLVGVSFTPQTGFQIWGIINSGKRWLQSERGGSKKSNKLPEALVIHVNGPGMLTICRGVKTLAVLNCGRVVDSSANVFTSQWMKKLFANDREDIIAIHEAFRSSSDVPVAKITDEFIESMQFQLLKRTISATRMASHGGSFLIFPGDQPPELGGDSPHILLKYAFADDEAIRRQIRLFRRTIEIATTLLADPEDPDKVITWDDYVGLRHETTYDLEEAFYEQAQFVASLAAVDGAVVVNKGGAIGFGGMIVGSLDKLTEIAMATDTEGKMVTLEKIEGSGSRHRSVYHLCNALHHVMAIVVSQDGSVQLAKWRNGIVTCWDLTSSTFTGEV